MANENELALGDEAPLAAPSDDTIEPVKQRRKRRTKAEMEAALGNVPDGETAGDYVSAGEASTASLEPVKKRGRKGKKTAPHVLAGQIRALHMIAANMTGVGEILLSDPEAEMLAGSIVEVMEQYDFSPSGKVAAIIGLVGALGVVYVPRLMLVRQRAMAGKARSITPQAPAAGNPPSDDIMPDLSGLTGGAMN